MIRLLRAQIGFLSDLARTPWPVRSWVGLLILVNGLVPLAFFDRLEAKVAVVTLVSGGLVMGAIFARHGYVRLLGAGHVFWLGVVPWLAWRGLQMSPDDPIRVWVFAVVAIDSVSLVIDAADVVRWIRGEREPMLPPR